MDQMEKKKIFVHWLQEIMEIIKVPKRMKMDELNIRPYKCKRQNVFKDYSTILCFNEVLFYSRDLFEDCSILTRFDKKYIHYIHLLNIYIIF